jgi:8-oxo-dGTP diphosphatase
MGKVRAGVVIVRGGRLAVIERVRRGQHYWVLPGGAVEPGESTAQAAQREAEEELGVAVRLGPLRVLVRYHKQDGSIQRQWYYGASTDTSEIAVVGPELGYAPESGTYAAVWLDLQALQAHDVRPSAVARLIAANGGAWPATVIEIDEHGAAR